MTDYVHKTEFPGFYSRFKVGDRVKLSDSHPRFPGRDAVVTCVFPTGFIKVKVDGAEDIEVAERLISANSRSRNAVVQKALNAVARNFTPTSEFEIGDKVRFRDSVRSVPHDETYTVVKVSGKNITIKGGRDNGTSTEFANNLEIVENADTSTISEKAMNAKFYATGYTNGGANEKQIGPFKTKEEAIKAGREEQGASGTFRFAGVVGEDGAYVYHNSCSRNAKFKVGDKVYFHGRPATVKQVIREPDADYILDVQGDEFYAENEEVTSRNSRSTNAVVAKALNAQAVCNASYSAALKAIMDAVKPYMDRRITDDTSWRYPALVISKLRDVCERAVMSAGRYDGKRPPHRVYDVECVKDGFKFSGNLIVTGLLHRDDPDDVSAFDEYDMTLSLGYTGKA